MTKYDVLWTGVDAGSEQQWREPVWSETVKILDAHEGEEVHNTSEPVYADLLDRLPDVKWVSEESDGQRRSLFRDYPHAWTQTGLIDLSDGRFRITDLGRQFVAGEVSSNDILFRLFCTHRSGTDYPFRILAAAFLEAEAPLAPNQLHWSVMRGYRPGIDNLEEELRQTPDARPPGVAPRRLRHMLSLLAQVGAIRQESNTWKAVDYAMLAEIAGWDTFVPIVHRAMTDANLRYDDQLLRRYISSLLAKPFVILTGLSGSGKTRLAQSFASWLGCSATDHTLAVIPVGPDWSTRDAVLGYPDALDQESYIRTPALDLLLNAQANPNVPHFLILDEMNLSHVERYFADLLSAMESGEPINLHDGPGCRSDVPPRIDSLPSNLFIVGTVNVDETTYMFSPKVLDRANAIEFQVGRDEMESFLANPSPIVMDKIAGKGKKFAEPFVGLARQTIAANDRNHQAFQKELLRYFDALEGTGAEFGFRTAMEAARYIGMFQRLSSSGDSFKVAMDSVIAQKLLPKLNGSRAQLEPVLCTLGKLCHNADNTASAKRVTFNACDLLETDQSGNREYPLEAAHYQISFDKICRMLRNLQDVGFTSFAEA